jgi:hypothetical protein
MSDDAEDAETYRVKYRLWEKTDDARKGRGDGGHVGKKKTVEGFFNEPTPQACINAIVYELRGVKSDWELAYVDEIEEVHQ